MSILQYFPKKFNPRKTQITALEWLEENQNKKYFFCNLPVGSGKSHIGITFADYLKSKYPKQKAGYILTPQKTLQVQYEDVFNEKISSLYGRNNYQCRQNNTTCDIGALLKPSCKTCPSNISLTNAINADITVMNYHLALIKFNCTEQFNNRNLLVFDECHQLEKLLTDYNNITISRALCDKHKIKWCTGKTLRKVHEWIMDYYWPALDSYIKVLQGECDDISGNTKITPHEMINLKQLLFLNEHLVNVNEFLQEDLDDLDEKYILSEDPENIKIKYVFGSINFHKSFQHIADKFLFLSATIFDYQEICKNLEIPLKETCFISLDSEFDKDIRPVIYRPTMKMSYGWEDKLNDKQKMISNIKSVLNSHEGENGIIHTGNFAISKWISNEIDGLSHNILHHNPGSGDNRNKIIENYMKSKKPSILVSPSITEGLDLCQDKARFVIFAKISFGSLADKWIKHRMSLSSNWYLMNALTDVMQGCGRVVRSEDDFGVVYILDESFGYLLQQTKHKIPQWWLDAFHKI